MDSKELKKLEILYTEEEFENEIWKPIKNFEEYYEVSSLGRFKSKDREIIRCNGAREYKRGRILKNSYYSNNYVQLSLKVKGTRYTFIGHRVVAEHFIDNPDNLPIVNHLNSITWDNRVFNLEWNTLSGNMQHMIKEGRQVLIRVKGEQHPHAKLTNEEVAYIKANYIRGKFNEAIFNEFSDRISRSGFNKICHGSSWKHI